MFNFIAPFAVQLNLNTVGSSNLRYVTWVLYCHFSVVVIAGPYIVAIKQAKREQHLIKASQIQQPKYHIIPLLLQ